MADTVTIPATEYAMLKALQQQVMHLEEQLAWFRRQVFGQKSERFSDLPGELPVLPGLVVPEAAAPVAPPVAVPAHQRQGTRGKGSCTLELPDSLPRVEVLVDVPVAERTLPDGRALVPIGEERSEKLAFRHAEYYVLVTVRPKYALPGQPGLGVVQEPMPPTLIAGSKFDASFLAHLVTEKFQYHLPLYRIAEKLAGRDLRVTRQTLAQALKSCGQKVVPLFHLMREKLLADGCLFVDETPVKLQAPGKCQEARLWVYVNGLPGAPAYHVYQFTVDRSHRHPIAFLRQFQGTIHADAFGAYEKLDQDPQVPLRWAACWAHARRKFEEAQSGDADLRQWVLRQIRYLFLFERVAWARDADQRRRIRADHETPLVDALFARLRETVAAGTLLPKSQLAEAIGYLLSRPANFRYYLTDPNLRMDNNTAERALRKLTIGRKNWLFIGSPSAGDAMAALLSLVQTCRAMGIAPQAYLEDLFRRLLDHPHQRLAELLPDRWQAARTSTAQA